MPGVVVREGDHIDKVLRVFKRQVERAGIKNDTKKRESYEKPSIKRKKKAIAARKRRMKQLRKLGLQQEAPPK
jgi:small subunit ribosomal protein S21